MSALIGPEDLTHEIDIVWVASDIGELDYVRQALDRVRGRRSAPPFHRDGRLVGYAVLGDDAKPSRASGTHLRRVFWVAPHDRDSAPEGLYKFGAPSEAVDPRTVEARVEGCKTVRSQATELSVLPTDREVALPSV
ncbi:DUF6009 family protein [Streptomyces sp. NPDC014734]|uniref:DUF6009 family protein n=1 Tax=Streptomyces sp. NPDC014734 TaxID=3364886 RepID=UPI0036F64E75